MAQSLNMNQPGQLERRKRGRRFTIAAAARFVWTSSDGTQHEGKGTTRDVCLNGVFIQAYLVPNPGSPIEVTLVMPPMVKDGAFARLVGRGTVLRLDAPDLQRKGFAAQVEFQTTGAGPSAGS
jgi:hypothetical protein